MQKEQTNEGYYFDLPCFAPQALQASQETQTSSLAHRQEFDVVVQNQRQESTPATIQNVSRCLLTGKEYHQ